MGTVGLTAVGGFNTPDDRANFEQDSFNRTGALEPITNIRLMDDLNFNEPQEVSIEEKQEQLRTLMGGAGERKRLQLNHKAFARQSED